MFATQATVPLAAGVLDYVRTVNHLCEDLLRSHGDLLLRKNICGKRDFIQAIKLDLDKLTHALLEVRENRARTVLQDFFGDDTELTEISKRLADESIFHVGFEIHEPLDLVLYGINHWIEHSRQALGVDMRVRNYLRFPASGAFQERVGAKTEILRIWLNVHDRELMLELFDIHRPADNLLASAPRVAHRNFTGLFRDDDRTSGHQQRVIELFAEDEIWHYALSVRNPEDVDLLHSHCQLISATNPAYRVPYNQPVDNRHDGSFHTKIVRQAQAERGRMELEFVTHC